MYLGSIEFIVIVGEKIILSFIPNLNKYTY